MLPGLHGTLVSEYFAEHLLAERFAGRLGEGDRDAAARAIDRVRRACASLGPASGIRAIFDVGAAPLAGALGFRVASVTPFDRAGRRPLSGDTPRSLATLLERGDARVAMLVVGWGDDLDAAWRDSIRVGIDLGVRWCLLFNARQVRLVDSLRSYGRDHVEFDLDATCEDAASFRLFWAVLRAEAFAPGAGRARSAPTDRRGARATTRAIGTRRCRAAPTARGSPRGDTRAVDHRAEQAPPLRVIRRSAAS